jgi:hypothetical protein
MADLGREAESPLLSAASLWEGNNNINEDEEEF